MRFRVNPIKHQAIMVELLKDTQPIGYQTLYTSCIQLYDHQLLPGRQGHKIHINTFIDYVK